MSLSGSPGGNGAEPAGRIMVAAFTATTFLAAFLLFLVEPMVTKMLLPLLGGAPAAWNTAMVFFQLMLLGGYAFAFASMRWLSARTQAAVQLAALALPLLLLPVAVPGGWVAPTDRSPVWWTLLVLVPMVGAPFFMLASMGPTLQRWFSRTSHPRAHDPYFLYAAGNAGSLLGLLAYPFVFEAVMPLSDQGHLWTGLYVLLLLSAVACVTLERRRRSPAGAGPEPRKSPADSEPAIAWRRRRRWVFLAFIPSTLMLGVTRHLASDVASFPLLWVAPLAIYLITFIVAFGRESPGVVTVSARVLRLMVVPLTLGFFAFIPSLWIELPLQLIPFAAAALIAHGRLAADRPGPARLTEFFLWLSVGGVLGGIFASLVAPLIFTTVLEYPIAVVLALLVMPGWSAGLAPAGARWPAPRTIALGAAAATIAVAAVLVRHGGSAQDLRLSMVIAGIGLAGAYLVARTPAGYAAAVGAVMLLVFIVPGEPTLFSERTFFGIHRVYSTGSSHILLNGTTVHGIQDLDASGVLVDTPEAYYAESGPFGRLFATLADRPPMRIGVIGAGAGELAAYGRPADAMTFYEIDDAVVRVATNPSLFSYVHDASASVRFVVGDGRLSLQRDSAARYNLLVLDAFSSDAIPTHLLTDQAVQLYERRLTAHGLIACNVSNRFFDLQPILGRAAAEEHLTGVILADTAVTPAEAAAGKLSSTWIVLARSGADLGALASDPAWQPLGDGAGAPLWTDGFTNLLGTLR
ncbi:MAG: fused MFS/spermidine synthase [Actinomycetota bacterium]